MSKINSIEETGKVNKIYPEILEKNSEIIIESDGLISLLSRSDLPEDIKNSIRESLENISVLAAETRNMIYDDCEKENINHSR